MNPLTVFHGKHSNGKEKKNRKKYNFSNFPETWINKYASQDKQ